MSRSPRNKTINTSLEDGTMYLARCVDGDKLLEVCDDQDKEQRLTVPANATIHGDCLKLMKYMPNGLAGLVIADPPYNLDKDYNGKHFSKMNDADYEDYSREWISAVRPLLKDNGSIYVCCDWKCSMTIGRVLGEFFTIRNRITWQREKGRGASSNWKNSMEDIWFATVSDEYTFNLDDVKIRRKVIAPYREKGEPKDWQETEEGNFRDTCPSNFWDDITVPFWSMSENTEHPTQKPEKLIAKLILASTNAGDMVFDPFLGSGTTSVTAKKLGRNYIGIEREARYCIWAEQRLEMAEKDKRIQGYEDHVFWERNVIGKK